MRQALLAEKSDRQRLTAQNKKMRDLSDKSHEANRKCNNIWYRVLALNIITRRCAQTGLRLVKENACHTSFIGNIKYDFCDSVNAAVEIGHRGLMRYISGTFYPQMTEKDRDTMTKVAADGDQGDAHDITYQSWKEAYKSIKGCYKKKADFEHRYRTNLTDCQQQSVKVRNRYYNSGI